MHYLSSFFNAIFFKPLFNLLIGFYLIFPDLGVAIIALTIATKLLLVPVSRKSIESQKKLQELQPEIKKIQKKYKDDKQEQGQKIMALYKEKKVNPAGGCLPLIIQLVILIALYRVFMAGVDANQISALLYSFVPVPQTVDHMFFNWFDLAKPFFPLAIVAAILQFFQGKMMLKTSDKKKETKEKTNPDEPDFSAMMQQQMVYMGPALTLFIGLKFASGLVLYWLTSTIFMIIQQYYIIRKDNPKKTFWEILQAK